MSIIERVHFLNVGNGDCTILEHLSGRVSMIDVCKARDPDGDLYKLDKSASRLRRIAEGISGNFGMKLEPTNPIEYLRAAGIGDIFRFVLTHPDMDHMDGIEDLFGLYPPVNFWDTDNTCEKHDWGAGSPYRRSDWEFYRRLRSGMAVGTKRLVYHAGQDPCDFWSQDGLFVLAPHSDEVSYANRVEDYNELSYVIRFQSAGGCVALVCGDSHDRSWDRILIDHRHLVESVDLLIAPHHGRDSDRDFGFLDVVRPKLTLLGNASSSHLAYGEWSRRGLKTVTNNQAGNVVVLFLTSGMHVLVENERFARAKYPQTDYFPSERAWYLGKYA